MKTMYARPELRIQLFGAVDIICNSPNDSVWHEGTDVDDPEIASNNKKSKLSKLLP